MHLEMAKKYMKNKGKNIKITGSPKIDERFDNNFIPNDIWKPQDKPKKRIIWAPHRSDKYPMNMYQYNGFYVLYDYMFELAEKYKDEVQFVFRPHPVLNPTFINVGAQSKQKNITKNGMSQATVNFLRVLL